MDKELLKNNLCRTVSSYIATQGECQPKCTSYLRTVPKWISIETRLPEPGEEVLLLAHGWEGRLYYIGKLEPAPAQEGFVGVSKASDWTIWGWSYFKKPQVTHWMPLPKAPTETAATTNADRIRAMSDEKMAHFLILSPEMEFDVCRYCNYWNPFQDDRYYCMHDGGRCFANARCEAFKKWLREPVAKPVEVDAPGICASTGSPSESDSNSYNVCEADISSCSTCFINGNCARQAAGAVGAEK